MTTEKEVKKPEGEGVAPRVFLHDKICNLCDIYSTCDRPRNCHSMAKIDALINFELTARETAARAEGKAEGIAQERERCARVAEAEEGSDCNIREGRDPSEHPRM